MTEADLLAETMNLLFEGRGRVGSVYMQHIYLEKVSTGEIAPIICVKHILLQVAGDAPAYQ